MEGSRIKRVCDIVANFVRSHPFLTLCLVGGYLSFVGISHELWTPDEPRDAAVGKAMWVTGEWVIPRLNGEPFLEKPPLYWWSQSAIFALFGYATPTLARLPSALFGYASLLLTYLLGRPFFSARSCLLAGLILLTTALFMVTTHWIVVDNALLFSVTGAWTVFVYAQKRAGAARQWLLFGLYLFLALAFLAKGIVGLGIPVLGMMVYLLWSGQLRRFVGWHLLPGGALVAGVATLWLWFLWLEGGPESLETFLVYNQFGRFFPGTVVYKGGHERPFWYYFVNTPADLLPWTPFVLLAAITAWRHWDRLFDAERDGARLCASATLPVFFALSLAGTKRGLYLLPIFPLIALLVGWWATTDWPGPRWQDKLERWWDWVLIVVVALSPAAIVLAPRFWFYWLPGVALLILFFCAFKIPLPQERSARLFSTAFLLCLALGNLFITVSPFIDRFKSFVPFVEEVERQAGTSAPLFAYRPDETTLGVVSFYTGRSLAIVGLDDLKVLAEGSTTKRVVVRDSKPKGGNYGEITSAGIPHRLISEQLVGDSRTMRIIAVGVSEGLR